MTTEMHEQFFQAVKGLYCPLCSGELEHHESRKTPIEVLEFFYCENCGSELTMIVDPKGSVDFDFCSIIHREEIES